jgi:hypothetical protein
MIIDVKVLLAGAYARRMVIIAPEDELWLGLRNKLGEENPGRHKFSSVVLALDDNDPESYKPEASDLALNIIERMVFLSLHDPNCRMIARKYMQMGHNEMELPPFVIEALGRPTATAFNKTMETLLGN